MSIEALLIGLLYIALYTLVLCIVVYAVIYICGMFGIPLPHPIPRLLWAIVGIIVLIMLLSLVFGWKPTLPFRGKVERGTAFAALSAEHRQLGDVAALDSLLVPTLSPEQSIRSNGDSSNLHRVLNRNAVRCVQV